MLIKVEPAGFFMYTVMFYFDVEHPDAEDEDVRGYLVQHELEPRYQWDDDSEGRKCNWMQFGGCYLGNHLQEVGQIQRRAVEVELLTEEIEKQVGGVMDCSSLSDDRRSSLMGALVAEFQKDSSFYSGDNGELSVSLDRSEVLEALNMLLAS